MTWEQIVHQARQLSVAQRKQLIALLVDSLTVQQAPAGPRSVLELEGLGAELWRGVDAQTYTDALRTEWDERNRC